MSATADRFAQFHSTYTGLPSADAFRSRKPARSNPTRDIVLIGLASTLTMVMSFWVLGGSDLVSVTRLGAELAAIAPAQAE